MKQQFLDLTGLTELVAYIESNVTDKKEILPYASNKLFPSTGDVNAIYIDTATNTIYRWDTSSKTYIILAKAVKSVSISESTENGKITLTVDGVKTTVPIHGLGSAAYTNSNAYSPADHTHTKAQIGLGSVDNTADKDKSVKHANTADSATTAGTATTATNVNGENATVDAARHVWFSDSATETKRNYNDKFKYNPATNTVTANISGSAASANSVLWSGVTNKPSTFTPSAHNHDDSTITSLNASKLFGTIDIARLPQGALERLVIVADDTARFKLTTANVQLGDTVKVIKTEKMYYVVDESKLSSEAGYSVYTAGTATSVPWSGVTGKPSSYPPASHNHDERYYTETEMNSKLAEKAPKVHTHVKSEVGLGNVDNTADANKSVKYAASAGTASSCTGNAATATKATKLATARSINGTNFDGSGNITTASWGTARNVTIGNTKKSVNGASDVAWSLGEIGAAAASHSHGYLPLSGGTMTGDISYKGSKATYEMIRFIDNPNDEYGNGIAIGGGGLTIVGGGESANAIKLTYATGGDEHLILANDGPIDIYTNCQDGLSKATHVTIDNSGLYSGTAAKANSVPWSGVTGRPSSLPASDVYAWAKASTKPSYTKAEVGLGNVDNTADSAKSVKYATSAGSASSATKATQDSAGQQINTTYVKSLSVSGRTITITKGNGTTSTITTQDTNTDTKVTQTAVKSSDYTNWRTIPWGSSNSGSEGFTPTTAIDVMYSDPNLTYQPSSGTLRAKTFKGTLNGTAYEANLAWGGHNFAGSYGPIDAAMIPTLGANRLAFIPPESITVTYSRDGGSTWSDYGASSDTKRGLFSTGSNLTIGKADSTNKATANSTKYQLRITIDTDKASVYTVLNKFAISVSTNGSNSCWCTIDASLEKTPTTWVNFAKQVSVSGWSGWNIINTDGLTTYGNNPSVQYGLVRFTFGANGGSTTYTGLQVLQILGFGGFGWSTPSNMARHGHLYNYDIWQNAFFPAQVNANNMLMNTCVNCSNWNDAVKTGWYMASGASNAPTSGAWYFGMVIAHNSNYVIQELYQFTASTDAKSIPKYIRAKMNGTWGSWTDVTVQVKVPSGAKFTDTNTWRPLGTTGDTACAGNDSRLSNARPASDVYAWAKASSKPSYSWGEITGKPSTFTPASHTHNYAGSSSAGGNANAAVKLATARSINGTNFDGSGNITTANWGTARTITVGNTGKSVNGSGNVSWSLGEIGIHVSNKEPAASEGKNGDVWIVYEG